MFRFIGMAVLLLFIGTVSVFAQSTVFYVSDDFSVDYLDSWELVETDDVIRINFENYTLTIQKGEAQMGLPAGEFERWKFVGQYGIPVDTIVYDGKIKQVMFAHVVANDLALTITLDVSPVASVLYEDVDIPLSVIDEATMIVDSLKIADVEPANVIVMPFFSGEQNPIDAWESYTHTSEPFGFRYPDTWTLSETEGQIALTKDDVTFYIAYAPLDAEAPMMDFELLVRSYIIFRPTTYGLHQAISTFGIDPEPDGDGMGSVGYHSIVTPDNQFAMWARAKEGSYIDRPTLNEIDLIISTFKTRPPAETTVSN